MITIKYSFEPLLDFEATVTAISGAFQIGAKRALSNMAQCFRHHSVSHSLVLPSLVTLIQ